MYYSNGGPKNNDIQHKGKLMFLLENKCKICLFCLKSELLLTQL